MVDLIIGNWYRTNDNHEWFIKFNGLKKSSTDNTVCYSEYIMLNTKKHSFCSNCISSSYQSKLIEVSYEDLQKYLPISHPDRMYKGYELW